MSRTKGAPDVDIAVIDEELLRSALVKERQQEYEENAFEKQRGVAAAEMLDEPVVLEEVTSLTLSFKNVVKIDNLVGLNRLTALRLDNNIIRVIENLSHLTTLTWLDLSFNNIEKLQGLDRLVHLTDLSLFNNNIRTIEGLEKLTKLQVLSLGNNSITSTDAILALRPLKSLRVVTLEGNPVCADAEYRTYALAFVPQLEYLDYVLVKPEDRQAAKEAHQDELQELLDKEGIDADAKRNQEGRLAALNKLRNANLEPIATLFESMFQEDSEMSKLKWLPGVDGLVEDYKEQFDALTEEFKADALQRHEAMQQERKLFDAALQRARDLNSERSVELAQAFAQRMKHEFRGVAALLAGVDASAKGSAVSRLGSASSAAAAAAAAAATSSDRAAAQAKRRLAALRAENERLAMGLRQVETELVEQSEELVSELEGNTSKMSSAFRDALGAYFRAVEELENTHFDALTTLAEKMLAAMNSEAGLDDELVSEADRELVVQLLSDRDALMTAVTGSHDVHVGKLLGQEDKMRQGELSRQSAALAAIREEEAERNRLRMQEIRELTSRNLRQIAELEAELEGDDEEP